MRLRLQLLVRTGALAMAGIVVLSFGLPPDAAHAKGAIWLKTQRAATTPEILHPSMATYRNHAYILSVHETTGAATNVYLTTNESGKWKTSLVSTSGPGGAYSQEFVALAIDASQNKLYAAWIYRKDGQHEALGVWTRTGTGAWSGPTDVAQAGALVGEPSIVAGGGHATVAFLATPQVYAGSCDDKYTHAEDLQVASTSGGAWSTPQNLTSCATGQEATSFNDPKLAIDEAGKLYVVSRAGDVEGNLWYADTTGGVWSQASALTSGLKIPETVLSPQLRTVYGIAASRGVAYIVYSTGQKSGVVRLLVRAANGAVSPPVQASVPDNEGCPQFGVSVAARAGRVLVAYVRAYAGYCTVISTSNNYNRAYLMAGTATRLTSIATGLPKDASCGDTALSTDGDIFRLTVNCGIGTGKLSGILFYKKEFLDVVGPKASLRVSRPISAGKVRLQWSAYDPTPGSGIGYYQLEVRGGTAAWKMVARSTRARSITYLTQRGHKYTFRLRARDRVNNWGKWVSIGVRGS